ncbi:5-formyltetrahydrofolate cyclo-ligase [Actinobacteria bacterium YIM 96077]|uniref:5-formyltetrahydrofolate cyclo-ligase n=2 Tax=Phytoactinopolyspora halophila TaxID=1981511 RepID=A0A329QT37_9ACTN|nr:5-formyltetrahydrofolate cyclo-ligase [Actinobacteria bacterium YIM 96077]RAW15475.1 5-formyltetrahydrofolate cyclo-ligase [Phytoactinopolyspora halophila]
MPVSIRESKRALRERVTANRGQLSAQALAAGARELRDLALELPEMATARRVATYVSVGAEPGTGPLIEALYERGVELLLPVLLPDYDLDWGYYRGPSSLASAPKGLLEPTGPTLGAEAIAEADLLLVPALAVDRHGTRLGKGAGCYDRVLARLAGQAPAFVLLHDGEILDIPIPKEPHDVPVDRALTPSGIHHLRP